MYKTAFEIKEILQKERLNPTILDPIFIKPLNEDLFKKLASTHEHIITLEEHSIKCGFGSIFNDFIIQNNLKNRVLNFALPDRFIEHGGYTDLMKDLKLDAESISKKILDTILEKQNI